MSDAARAQLEAVRDEWLQPLIDQLRDTERALGRNEAERDLARQEVNAARLERDALQAELDRLREAESANDSQDALEPPRRADPVEMIADTLHEEHNEPVPAQVQLATGWRRWFRWLMES